MERPKALIFDWDNTLVDTWPCIIRAMNDTLVAMGRKPWSLDEAKNRIAKSLRESFPVLFADDWKKAEKIFYDSFAAVHMEMLVSLPGAEGLLQQAADQGIYLAVVSNKKGSYLRSEAEHLGWTKYFARIVGAGDAQRDKPAVEPVHLALDGSGVSAGEAVWFIGDNAVDIKCGTDSGCVPVLVSSNEKDVREIINPTPRHVFGGCDELATFLNTQMVPFKAIR